jgi:RNA polymerase sigma-70 factor, ECF subfamily
MVRFPHTPAASVRRSAARAIEPELGWLLAGRSGQSTRAALALVAELPADQAEVVALRVLGGLDVAEVARIVGKRPGTVRVLAHRGLRRLARRVEGAGLLRGVTR